MKSNYFNSLGLVNVYARTRGALLGEYSKEVSMVRDLGGIIKHDTTALIFELYGDMIRIETHQRDKLQRWITMALNCELD